MHYITRWNRLTNFTHTHTLYKFHNPKRQHLLNPPNLFTPSVHNLISLASMGNRISHRPSDLTGKVILSDGTVHKYDEPLTVAELMLEHPQQVVVEFNPKTDRKRATPLPADKKLEMNKVYIMVPKKRVGKAAAPGRVISSEEARRVLLTANVALNSKATFMSAYTGFLPFFARIRPAGDVAASKKDGSNYLVEKSREMWKIGLINEGLEEDGTGPEFLSRQLSGKNSWKPSLDTIKEKGVKAKIHHWLL